MVYVGEITKDLQGSTSDQSQGVGEGEADSTQSQVLEVLEFLA